MRNPAIEIRWTKGQGPGGQRKNKVATCCVMTHVPTGLIVRVDGRSRRANEKAALKLLMRRVRESKAETAATTRKARRDERIHEHDRIRTYDFSRRVVTDHRTGKTASIKDILGKGLLDKLR